MNHKSVLMTLLILLPAAASGAEIINKDGNKLDLYGQLNGVHYFSSDADNNGDRSYTRFGFKGETQIGDALTGYGQWEYQAGLDQPESAGPGDSYTRPGFAGLAFGHWGSLDYGRNYGLLYDVAGWTDVLPEFGNDSYEAADNFMTGRANGLLTYHNRSLGGTVDGTDLGLQYQGKNRGTTLNGRRISRRKTAMATPFPPPTAPAWGSTLAPPTPTLRARWRNSASARLTAIAPGHGPQG